MISPDEQWKSYEQGFVYTNRSGETRAYDMEGNVIPDEKRQGIIGKYRVGRVEDPTGKHADCRYLVLDPQHDPLARVALAAYAAAAKDAGYENLSRDLDTWLRLAPS